MEAYFDNSATTACHPKAAELMVRLLSEDFGNPSSLHTKGMIAEQYLTEAKKKIARVLKVQEKEILFTSGGTESNNMALIGSAMANMRAGKHIITTAIEHASITSPLAFLEEQGFEITYLKVDSCGIISLEELEKAMREDTILVSVMHVNNEIGAVEPIEQIGKIVKQKNPNCIFHVDAIQSFGKFIIHPKKCNIDLLSVSGHKIHGPKGSGILFIKEKTRIKPLILGGGQQKGMRSGTENVPAYAGLGVAVEEIYTDFEEKIKRLYELRKYFIEEVLKIDGVSVNGKHNEEAAPHIISVSVKNVRAEVLLHSLEEKGVYVSSGSACSSNKPHLSGTLKNIGLPKDLLDSTVRFSMCVNTTKEELDYALLVMKELVPRLAMYTRH